MIFSILSEHDLMHPTNRQQISVQGVARVPLLDRDQSILAFNERVLDWAHRLDVPLLERLRFLCIVSANLDEFFEVRAEPHLVANQRRDESGRYTVGSFERLAEATHTLVSRQYSLYNDDLLPALEEQGIRIIAHEDRNAAQRRWVKLYFESEVRPLLIPVGLDPAHPFPQVPNKSLNFIVRLGGLDAFGRENDIAIVKVPRILPRMIHLPEKVKGVSQLFVSIASVIRAHLGELFPGREVVHFAQFRVTRHSDLAVDEEEVKNLRTALRLGLEHRHFGQAVRLEVSATCSDYLTEFLRTQFDLPEQSVYRVRGPVNLVRLGQVLDLLQEPQLCFSGFKSCYPRQLVAGESYFEKLKHGDVLIHQPFESFGGVLDFLREAVNDPLVLAIKQTIYRTGSDSELMDLLREAVRRGKEVTAVVELKARFDEETNINWAEQLELVGAQVLYGVVGLKTHCKMMLITRREGRHLRRYAHLSTGNYNPRTARLYTDWSHISADIDLTSDVEKVFVHLASHSRLPKLRRILLAPFDLQRKMIDKVNRVAACAGAGGQGRIVVKMNALTDEKLIEALIRAGQSGAKIDLIVRGACMLPAQVPGFTDNIQVRSVVGRFLEHTRIFYFGRDEEDELFLSSADWMNRNMIRRVELAWPVSDPVLRQRIIDEGLVPYLHDNVDAWELLPDGSYARIKPEGRRPPRGAQDALMARYNGMSKA